MVGRRVIGLTQANILVLLAVLSLQLLRLMLWQLLEEGDYQLKDTRILTAIFSLHTVMCSMSCSSVFTNATHEVCVCVCVCVRVCVCVCVYVCVQYAHILVQCTCFAFPSSYSSH